jgi:peptide/nickel transport system substrate-binding protein
VTVVEAATNRTILLVLNNQWGPFKDMRVQQAMHCAIDKQAILASILFDLGTVAVSACPLTMFGAIPVQDGGWPYKPAKAKQLLAEAIASQLRNVNVRANLSTMDRPSYVGMVLTPPDRTRVQMIVPGWAWPVLDCDGALYGQFHSAVAHPPTGLGPAFCKNERVDRLLSDARTTIDPEKRKATWKP